MECVHACRGHAGSVDCVAVNDDKDKVSGYKVKYLNSFSAMVDFSRVRGKRQSRL